MKKFLSILLALAVGFTFTFGSAMSAFAAWDSSAGEYTTAEEQKEILAAAKNLAVSKAADITENYDNTVVKGSSVDDITTYTIAKTDIEKAIEEVYSTQLDEIINGDSTDLNDYVNFAGNYDTAKKNTDCADVVLVAYKMLEDAKAAPAYAKAENSALEGYRAYLTGLVDKIDLSIYTDTVQNTLYTVDGEKYDTSAKAAAAWVKYYKAIINNAVIGDKTVTNTTASATEKWKANSFKDIYNAVFNAPIAKTETPAVSKIVVVKVADTVDSNITTDLTYKLSATLATKAGEAGDAATLAAAQASAIAKLTQAVAEYKASAAYDSKTQDAEIDAYVKAQTYRINNTDDKSAVNAIAGTLDKSAVATAATGTTYSGYIAAGEKYKADMATAKTKYTTLGYKWDDAEAAKAEVVALLAIYKDGTTPAVTYDYLTTAVADKYGKIVSTDLTASAKAAAKIDYSAVEAGETEFGTAPNKVKAETFKALVNVSSAGVISDTVSGKVYFAKQWDAVKAAYDTYNAAVDAAINSKNISDAGVVLYNTLAKIDDASTVYGKVDDATDTYANLNAYAKLVTRQANKAIYVTFVKTDEMTITSAGDVSGDLTHASVYVWMINKGASTKAEAEALYNDAKAVIDAYKTLDTLKSEAAAVNAQIAALPAKTAITLTDKIAIVAAYDAYDALPAVAKNYVTNKSTLDTAVAAVKAVEEYSLKAQAAALPKSVAAITVADKDAITAYKKAYEAYKKTTAYNGTVDGEYTITKYSYAYTEGAATVTKTGIEAALTKVQHLEADAIKAAYDALDVKYQANTLTAEDAEAVKALQDALNAYIDEYAEGITGVDEFVLAKISALVGTKATLTDAEAKAYVQDLAITARTAKVGKKVKVTINADVQTLVDNGFTVEYKFYKSTKKGSGYKNTVNKTTNTYTNTNPVKGKNYYKVKLVVKNADGSVVATNPLTQCKYGVRTIK